MKLYPNVKGEIRIVFCDDKTDITNFNLLKYSLVVFMYKLNKLFTLAYTKLLFSHEKANN